ncbi:stage II sporulation protein M [Oscillospiraceae bacterium OttesenSCG-928-F05]|nr:stage II sporulation protein M [Oscillospiraceae bacterium OttesenSCG-928-F05]
MKRVMFKIWAVGESLAARPAVFLLALVFLIGSAAGCVAAANVGGEAEGPMVSAVLGYFSGTAPAEHSGSVFSVISDVAGYPLLLFFLGFSVVGPAAIPAVFAARGFVLTYTVAAFLRVFGAKGVLLAMSVFAPQMLFALPCLFVFGAQGISASLALCRGAAGRGKSPGPIFDRAFWRRSLAAACILSAGVLVEWFVTPRLVTWVFGVFS